MSTTKNIDTTIDPEVKIRMEEDLSTPADTKMEPELQEKVAPFFSNWRTLNWKKIIKHTAVGVGATAVALLGPASIILPFVIPGATVATKGVLVTAGILQTSWWASLFCGDGDTVGNTSILNAIGSFPLFVAGCAVLAFSTPTPIFIAMIIANWFFFMFPFILLMNASGGEC